MKELSKTSVILGILLVLTFGAANAYLGLRVGMTISASIPAAVISMGIIRVLLKKNAVLENNMVQTIGSAGESVAAGAIFTMPVLFMWASQWQEGSPSYWKITIIALCGSMLGVLFMIPLRKILIEKEDGNLPYPEGTACAQVIKAGAKETTKGMEKEAADASGAKTVFMGLGMGALYKFICDGLGLFPSQVHFENKKVHGLGGGIEVLPALAGVGYICGPEIASYMLAGGIVTWIVLMPLIGLIGQNVVLYPGTIPIGQMDSFTIWGNYIRYIGAGAVATAGIISLLKTMPMIIIALKKTFVEYKNGGERDRKGKDIPIQMLIAGIIVIALAIWLLPFVEVGLWGTLLIIIVGFFFASVSARMVGMVGSSNNPVSGMAIATLLISSICLKVSSQNPREGMLAAIGIGAIICMIAATAGDTSQDLKTGFILGATPMKQQIGEIIGVTVAAFSIGGVMYLLNKAWGFGSQELPAPQAVLMKMVVEGVMEGNLPWVLVLCGAAMAIVMEILRIPALPFAVGMYLPLHLSAGIMAGGLVRLATEKSFQSKEEVIEEEKEKKAVEKGILFGSGLIAGEGLIGILLAVFTLIVVGDKSLMDWMNIEQWNLGNIGGIILFVLLLYYMYQKTMKTDSSYVQKKIQ